MQLSGFESGDSSGRFLAPGGNIENRLGARTAKPAISSDSSTIRLLVCEMYFLCPLLLLLLLLLPKLYPKSP
jgi:hypothetical protein